MGSGRLFIWKSFARDLRPPNPSFLPQNYPDLTGNVALVTGASSGIGLAVVKLLASKNCHVFLGVRSVAKTELAIKKIKTELGNNGGKPIGKLEIVEFDLADLTTIKTGAEQLLSKTDKLNIVIHNAGVMLPPPGSKTKQNYDLQFGTNVMAPFLLQKCIDPLFLKPDVGMKRLVWVSSTGHLMSAPGGINWDDLHFDKKPKDTMGGYAQSKAANNILSGMWPQKHAKQVKEQNIVSVVVHPGYLRSGLGRDLPKILQLLYRRIAYEPVYGAYSELFGLLSPSLTYKDNGAYIVPWGVVGDARDDVTASVNNGNGEKLWKYLEKETSSY